MTDGDDFSRLSKSEQIRRLAATGMSTKDIATRLGIRYQHVYGVLKGARSLAPIPAGLSRRRVTREPSPQQRLRQESESSVYDTFWDQENNVHRVVVRMYRIVPGESPFRPSVARYIGPMNPPLIDAWIARCAYHGYISQSDYDEQVSLIRAVLRKAEKAMFSATTNDWDTPPPSTPKPAT